MRTRRFTYKDIYNWKVVDVNGKVIPFRTTILDEEGKPVKVILVKFDGYRSAVRAAMRMGVGTPVRE